MKRIFAMALVFSSPALSQSLFSYSNDPASAQFDWDKITECAKAHYKIPTEKDPGYNNMFSPVWEQYKQDFNRISACRLALLARHEGWKAATDEPDPFPPVPMMPEFDLKGDQ